MPSTITYAVTFVLVFSAVVFIVLFGPAPRFRYIFTHGEGTFNGKEYAHRYSESCFDEGCPRNRESGGSRFDGGERRQVFGPHFLSCDTRDYGSIASDKRLM